MTEEKKQKRGWALDQLGFASNGFTNTSSFTLYIGLRDVYDAVLIKNFQFSPKPFVCWTARFKRDLCAVGEPSCVIEKWWLNLYLISQAARPAACSQYESPSWWEGHTCTKIGHWTQHTSTALRSLWNGKAMTYFLLDLASCTTVHAALGSARTVWAASWCEGHSRFEDCTHHTFIAPFWCAVPRICHEW